MTRGQDSLPCTCAAATVMIYILFLLCGLVRELIAQSVYVTLCSDGEASMASTHVRATQKESGRQLSHARDMLSRLKAPNACNTCPLQGTSRRTSPHRSCCSTGGDSPWPITRLCACAVTTPPPNCPPPESSLLPDSMSRLALSAGRRKAVQSYSFWKNA